MAAIDRAGRIFYNQLETAAGVSKAESGLGRVAGGGVFSPNAPGFSGKALGGFHKNAGCKVPPGEALWRGRYLANHQFLSIMRPFGNPAPDRF